MPYRAPDGCVAALQCLLAELANGILTVTLSRPAAGNALNVALTMEMGPLLQVARDDKAVRVVVLRGAGADFCLGVDDADFADGSRRDARAALDDWCGRALPALPQPTIALVHGRCHGGAVGVVEGCDIAFAADDAEFRLAPAGEGLAADGIVTGSTSPVMSPRAARLHALSDRPFDAAEAERHGLVTRSVAPSELEREGYALAAELAAKDPIALRFTKQTLRHVGAMTWDGVLDYTAAKLAELKASHAGRPSVRAASVESFLAGRSKPGLGG